jgi:hypothetical protein
LKPLNGRIENPLANVVNPHATRLRIQGNEEDLKAGLVPVKWIPDKVVEIANLSRSRREFPRRRATVQFGPIPVPPKEFGTCWLVTSNRRLATWNCPKRRW